MTTIKVTKNDEAEVTAWWLDKKIFWRGNIFLEGGVKVVSHDTSLGDSGRGLLSYHVLSTILKHLLGYSVSQIISIFLHHIIRLSNQGVR